MDRRWTVWPRYVAFAVAVALTAGSCGHDATTVESSPTATIPIVAPTATPTPRGDAPTSTASATPTPAPTPTPTIPPVAIPADPAVELTTVLAYDRPIAMAVRPNLAGGEPTLYLASKNGTVDRVEPGATMTVVEAAVIDIGDRLSTGNEQGLLGMAFSPDGGHLYVDYTDKKGTTTIAEWAVSGDGAVDLASERTVLTVAQPAGNHNAGDLAFGPDGYLYVTLGDGGAAGDKFGNGQNRETLLGSILRIAPDAADPYAVPADNPFAERDGRPEIWLYGVRNPWRISFDRATGDLWIGEVGQNAVEEIDVAYRSQGTGRGANLGWPLVEGSAAYQSASPPTEGYLGPIYEYSHADGCAVTGGYVYRGTALPQLQGIYVFGDYCSKTVWGLVSSEEQGVLGVIDLLTLSAGVSSFGQGPDGELYVLSLADNTVSRLDPAG